MAMPSSKRAEPSCSGRVPRGRLTGVARISVLLWAVIGGSTLACARPRPPTVTPEIATVAAITPIGIGLSVVLRVDNPNPFPLAAHAVSGTVFLSGGQRLGEGSAKPEAWVAARSAATVQAQVEIAWRDLPALAPFLTLTTIPYTFEGDVTLGGEDLNVVVPFKLAGKLTREQLIRAGLRGLPGFPVLPGLAPP